MSQRQRNSYQRCFVQGGAMQGNAPLTSIVSTMAASYDRNRSLGKQNMMAHAGAELGNSNLAEGLSSEINMRYQ